jgi:UDP-N-acetylglucosamine/UDP-N-acetylgalactosamine diphosphorylase
LAKNPCAFMVARQGNFAAVKNGPNQGLPDSPETARQAVSQYHMELIKAAGGRFANNDPGLLCEISPLISYNGENLTDLVNGKQFSLPLHLK